MWRGSRRFLAALALAVLAAAPARAADLGTMKVGVLKFGTVNWELDVIKANGLDTQGGLHPRGACRSAATTRPTWR